MKKRPYFCSMKHYCANFCYTHTIFTLLFVMIIGHNNIFAASHNHSNISAEDDDAIEFSLLTCSPRDQVYSLYGHTAIRYQNTKTNSDLVFNYGVFNFKKSNFILRFVLGLTDYELGIVPFDVFCEIYKRERCKVTEQTLNLSNQEKERLVNALSTNYLPQNRVYRYNVFYDNCTTRARDIIESVIDGTVIYPPVVEETSFRRLLHSKTNNHPWYQMGNDLCLGFSADKSVTEREWQFLPENLMAAFDSAKIVFNNSQRNLIKKNSILFDTSVAQQSSFVGFISPSICFLILLAVFLLIAFVEYKRHKTFMLFDISIMILMGIGSIVLMVFFFSKHPTTSTNLQILLFNPLPLFFILKVIKRRKTIYWKLSLANILLFFIGGLFQNYASGIMLLALCLITRCWINIKMSSTNIQLSSTNIQLSSTK